MKKQLRPLALLLAGLGLLWLLAPRAAELPTPSPRGTSSAASADAVRPALATASAAPVKAAERATARAVTPIAALAGAPGKPGQLAVRDQNAGAIFTPKGIRINLLASRPRKGERPDPARPAWGLEWGIEGAREVEPRPEAEQAAKIHDLRGRPEEWKSNQKTYGRVVYEQVKPGLDLIVDAAAHGVKYTLRAARAADVALLRLRYAGSTGLSASADGSTLEIGAGPGSIRESGLVVTQEGRPIAASYRVTGKDAYAIDLHGADPSKAVEVDPLIGWSTYLGGTLNQGNGGDYGTTIAVDGSGNVYVAGQTYSGDFPILGGFDATLGGFQDGFVTKLSAGGAPLWTTYLGGAGYDSVGGIAVDASGGTPNVYVTGRSDSADFPLVNPIDGGLNSTDAFVAKLSGSGVSILWSTFLGGNGYEEGRAIAVDAAGANVWVSGYTSSSDFPTGGGGFDSSLGGGSDLFLTKLNGAGTLITWSTFVGGGDYEDLGGIAVDGSGAVFMSGYTYSSDFPVTGFSTPSSIPDAFIIKVKPAATSLEWGRFLGGSDYDVGTDVALDATGNCFVTGYTYSFNFPVAGAPVYDGTQGGGTDAFLTKLDSAGTIVYSTYLGGNGYDYAARVRVDNSNRAIVAGYTSTFDATFPKVSAAFPAFNGGYYDGFVTKFSPSGSSLLFSTYYGGDSDEQIAGMAVDGSGIIHLTGYTYSTAPSFPTTGAFDNTLGGGQDAFVARFGAGGALGFSSYLGGNRSIGEDYGKTVDVDDLGNVYVGGQTYSFDFPVTPPGPTPPFQGSIAQNPDVTVTKYSNAATPVLLWSTYLGGDSEESIADVAVDVRNGYGVYAAGSTYSSTFPVTLPKLGGPSMGFEGDGYVSKLSPDGSFLLWSRRVGGSGYDTITAVALNSNGDILLVGETQSVFDYPVTPDAFSFSLAGSNDLGIAMLTSDGFTQLYGSYFGGTNTERPTGASFDNSDTLFFIGGQTDSSDLPTGGPNCHNPFINGGSDLFLVRFEIFGPAQTFAMYSSYLGGPDYEYGASLAVDSSGNAFLAGYTYGPGFPFTIGAGWAGNADGVLARFNADGTLGWARHLGGSNADVPYRILADNSSSLYVAGYTNSFDFPVVNPFQPSLAGGLDAFITKVDPNGSTLAWSSFLGGTNTELALGLAIGTPAGALGPSLYLVGETYSADFPKLNPTDGSFQGPEYFVTRVDNSNPSAPSSLAQFRSDGVTTLAVGAWTPQASIVVRANVGDLDNDAAALQVEILPIDTTFPAVGVPTATGAFGASPREVSVPLPVPPAVQQFHWRARTIDVHGRTSSWTAFGFNLDTPLPAARDVGRDPASDPPTVSTLTPTTGTTYTTSVSPLTFTGSASDLVSGVASVTWSNAASPAPVPSSGTATGAASWNVPSIPLSPGTNTITFTATDLAGNTGTRVVTVTYDTTPPLTTITGPTASATYLTGTGPTAGPPLGAPAGSILLTGTATDNAQVNSISWQNFAGGSGAATITGGTPGNRTWQALVTLTPGGNLIRVTSFDAANNLHFDEITVTYDNVAPAVNITGAPATTIASTATLTGTAVDATSGISLVAWSNPAVPASGTAAPPLGSWTIPGISLAPGANLITVTAVDGVLFPSTLNAASASVTVYRDVAAPAISILSPAPPSFVTGNAALTVTGTASDDLNVASVTWNSDQGDNGTATLSGPATSRSWSAACSLVAGPNVFTFSVSDGIRPAVTAQITITLSATAPSLVVSTPSASTSVTALSPFAMNGTAAAALGQTLVSITVTNTTTSVAPSVTGLGVWSVSVPLVIGTNLIEIVAEDDIGLTTTVNRTVILDPTAPAITITGPTGAASYATSAASVVLSGVASDNRGVASVAVVAGPAASLAGPPASVTWTTPAIPLALGTNVFTVQAVDEAGNTSTDVLTVTRDGAAPGITITSPTSASTLTVTVAGVVLGGFATDDVLLQVVTWINTATGASGSATGTSSWTTASIALNPGANVITVLAVDVAGNTQTDTITVFLDGANPAVTITSPTSDPSLDTPSATVSLGGTASDDVEVAAISWSRSPGGLTGSGNGTGTWSIDSIPLVAGSNVVTVTATDGAGRSSNDVITLVYDPTAPTIGIVSPATDPFSTTSTPQTITGTAGDNLAVTQVDWTNMTTGGSGTASGTTAWTCLTPLTSGPNAILVTARDAAGNTASAAITVVYDPAAPVVAISSPTSGISLTTGITPIVIGGTSSDDVGVAAVTWTTSGAVGTTSGGATGTDPWSFQVDLSPGENVITVTATDGVGRTGTTFLTVIYDAAAPTVTITSPTTDPTFLTVNAAVNLAGIAGDNLDLQSVAWANAATGAGGATVGVGSWSVNAVALNEGPNAITVTATDGVGKTGASVITVTRDGTNPLIDIVTPDNSATFLTSTRPLAIVGTASDNLGLASVTWTSDRGGGGAAALGVPGPGQWSTSVYLVAGLNVITFTATDGHGRTATDAITIDFTPENTAPSILIATPLAGPAATQVVAFAGSADDNVGIVGVTWINRTTGVAGVAALSGGPNPIAWTASVPLTAGANVLEATAVDDAGNTASASVAVVYTPGPDAVDPVADITGPTALDLHTSNVSPLVLTITATDNDGVAAVSWTNAGTGGDGTATPGTLANTWVASVALAFGTNVITITAVDPSGNEETDQIIVTFAPLPGDGVPPVVTITSHSTASTLSVSAALLSLAGTASDNAAVSTVIWADDASGLTGSAAGTSSWAVDVTLVPGINILTLKAYDTSGNTGTTTLTVLYTPPPPPPEVVPAGSCGLLGLDAAVLLLALAGLRRLRR